MNEPPKIRLVCGREQEIENQIAESLQLSESEFVQRLAIENYRSAEYLKAETLICLLNLARIENLPRTADLIASKLTKIVDKLVRKFLQNKGFDEHFVEEAITASITEMIVQVLGRQQVSYDFWEVNFYVSLERLTRNHLRKHADGAKSTNNFSELSSNENEKEFDFESNLPKFETLTIENKLVIKELLAKMTSENRMIFIRYHIDDWTQEQIAEVIGISSRTVRTRLREIAEFLKTFWEAKND